MKLSKIQAAVIALIAANIIWGATPPIFKWALEDITPFTLAFLRFFFATLIVLPFASKFDLKIQKKDWFKILLIAFVGVFIHISFFFLGLELTTSINAPIIGSAGPIFLMIAGALFLHETVGVKKIIGGVVGLIGVLIIVLLPILGESLEISVIGNLFILISALAGVTHVLLLKGISKDYDPIVLVFWSFALASIMFFPMFANDFVGGAISNVGFQGIFGVAFGAIFASSIAYMCLYSAIKYLPASEVGIFTYIDPVVTIMVAAPLLGEYPTPAYFLGAILVFLGIYIAEGRIHWHPIHLLKSK